MTTHALVKRWKSFVTKLMANEEPEDDSLDDEHESTACQASISSAVPRQITSVRGRVVSVNSSDVAPIELRVDIADASGRLTLVWMGRRNIAGVGPGSSITATGRVVGDGAHRVMFNPAYRLHA